MAQILQLNGVQTEDVYDSFNRFLLFSMYRFVIDVFNCTPHISKVSSGIASFRSFKNMQMFHHLI